MTPLATALLLSFVHLGAGQIDALHAIPRPRLLSFASGVAIALVFVELLPEFAFAQTVASQATAGAAGVIEARPFLAALLAVVMFLGLERILLRARRPARALADGSAAGGIYWVHIAVFAFYNALIGFVIVHRLAPGESHRVPLGIALALHVLVNDVGLRWHYKRHYGGTGRWILVASPLLGWGAAQGTTLSSSAVGVLLGFLAGGILLNTVKEELPEDREARFWPLAFGALVYALVAPLL